jgi:alpha-L-fucosidase 2
MPVGNRRLGPNLFNGGKRFQIDANFGLTAGVAEMLLQSHTPTTVELLPAMPTAWADGSVIGLRARGGVTVDIARRARKLISAVLRSTLARTVSVRYGGKAVARSVRPGQTYRFGPELARE